MTRRDVRIILLVCACFAFLVVLADGFTVLHWPHPEGWLGLGLFAFAASFLAVRSP